jgi:hypothetical protein
MDRNNGIYLPCNFKLLSELIIIMGQLFKLVKFILK